MVGAFVGSSLEVSALCRAFVRQGRVGFWHG